MCAGKTYGCSLHVSHIKQWIPSFGFGWYGDIKVDQLNWEVHSGGLLGKNTTHYPMLCLQRTEERQ